MMILYGWYQWLYGGTNRSALPITTLNTKSTAILSIIATLSIAIVVLLLKFYTNSTVPYLDATTTVLSIVAQWLICRKIIQCWHMWFIIDSMYVGMYYYKGIPAHMLLNII